MNILCTFSGKIGDILWSLATVDKISCDQATRVDMGIMPQYEKLIPLIQSQSYIRNAFVIPSWECCGSPFGDQPWQAPNIPCPVDDTLVEYDKVYNLTYKTHPPTNFPLIDFIAAQQGMKLIDPIPFIETDSKLFDLLKIFDRQYIAVGFNDDYKDQKEKFLARCVSDLMNCASTKECLIVNVTKLDWKLAALVIKKAVCYVGDRSSNHVLANGVGQKNIFIYEPHPHRNGNGLYGKTFTCPYTDEFELPHTVDADAAGACVLNYTQKCLKEKVCV